MTAADLKPYVDGAPDMIRRFEEIDSEALLSPVVAYLPDPPSRILDVGAGPGRDARWFAARGHDVVAAEPVAAFRDHGIALGRVTWIDDSLPDLCKVPAGDGFDLILAVGVWHHVPEGERASALYRMADLLGPSGRIILALRQGPKPRGPVIYPLDPAVEAARAVSAGLGVEAMVHNASLQMGNKNTGVTWCWAVFRKGDENDE